jgi:hypothetical protein
MEQILSKLPYILVFLLCVVSTTSLSSCGEGDNPVPDSKEILISNLTIQDFGNEGNSLDIFVSFSASGDLPDFSKFKVVVSRSSSPIDAAKVTALQSGSYLEIPVAEHTEIFLGNLQDADGQPIEDGVEYMAFILALPLEAGNEPALSEGSNKITLKDEIVVTTLPNSVSGNEDISIDKDNNLYVSGGGINTSSIFKITPEGERTTLSSSLNHAVGNVVSEDGTVYTTNFQSLNINKITSSGATSIYASDSRLTGGGGIIIDNEGSLFNTFYATSTLFKIKENSVEAFTTSTLFNGPVGMAYDKVRDKIYVANFADGKILMVAKDGTVTEIADTPATIGHIAYANDYFYITGYNQNKVYQVSLDGEITATIGTGSEGNTNGPATSATFNKPNGIEVSPDGKYVYVSQGNATIRKIIL